MTYIYIINIYIYIYIVITIASHPFTFQSFFSKATMYCCNLFYISLPMLEKTAQSMQDPIFPIVPHNHKKEEEDKERYLSKISWE